MRMRVPRVAVIAALGSALLVACAGPVPSPAPSPGATEPTALREPPEPRLPLSCDELVSPPTVESFAGTVLPLVDAHSERPDSWLDVAESQFGASSCRWESAGIALSMLIAPDSADYFIGGGFGLAPGYYERYDVFGDRSVHSCPYGSCTFEIAVDGHLITGYASRPDVMDEVALEALIAPVLGELTSAVHGVAEVRPRWTPPPGVLPTSGFGCPDDVPVAELAALSGLSRPYSTGTDWESGSFTALMEGVAPTWCTIASEDGPASLGLAVVAGGGWAFDTWSADPPVQWDGELYRWVEVDGLTSVLLGDEGAAPVWYDALFEVEGSLVSFGRSASSEQEFLALLPGVADILVEARP